MWQSFRPRLAYYFLSVIFVTHHIPFISSFLWRVRRVQRSFNSVNEPAATYTPEDSPSINRPHSPALQVTIYPPLHRSSMCLIFWGHSWTVLIKIHLLLFNGPDFFGLLVHCSDWNNDQIGPPLFTPGVHPWTILIEYHSPLCNRLDFFSSFGSADDVD
jgi:hypothetical protein